MYAFLVKSVETTRRSAAGSALRSGRKGRGFESRRLDQKSKTPFGVLLFYFYDKATGFEGGSRFARAKRFANASL